MYELVLDNGQVEDFKTATAAYQYCKDNPELISEIWYVDKEREIEQQLSEWQLLEDVDAEL